MQNNAVVYQEKFKKAFLESQIHLQRINDAFLELQKTYTFPLTEHDFKQLVDSKMDLAFADQIIYRFSKAQDSMGGKLFKSYILAQGSNADKPFLDILNQLEKLNILNVDEWFELREIRNEIAHDYEDNSSMAVNILNNIFKSKDELEKILTSLILK